MEDRPYIEDFIKTNKRFNFFVALRAYLCSAQYITEFKNSSLLSSYNALNPYQQYVHVINSEYLSNP